MSSKIRALFIFFTCLSAFLGAGTAIGNRWPVTTDIHSVTILGTFGWIIVFTFMFLITAGYIKFNFGKKNGNKDK